MAAPGIEFRKTLLLYSCVHNAQNSLTVVFPKRSYQAWFGKDRNKAGGKSDMMEIEQNLLPSWKKELDIYIVITYRQLLVWNSGSEQQGLSNCGMVKARDCLWPLPWLLKGEPPCSRPNPISLSKAQLALQMDSGLAVQTRCFKRKEQSEQPRGMENQAFLLLKQQDQKAQTVLNPTPFPFHECLLAKIQPGASSSGLIHHWENKAVTTD